MCLETLEIFKKWGFVQPKWTYFWNFNLLCGCDPNDVFILAPVSGLVPVPVCACFFGFRNGYGIPTSCLFL